MIYDGKQYEEFIFFTGQSIETAVNDLLKIQKEKGRLYYGRFNATNLYSDTPNLLQEAYVQITGMTKEEFDQKEKEQQYEYKRKEQEHKNKIPELAEYWIAEGKKILDEKHHAYWSKIVPIRLDDLYHGMELKCTIDLIKMLNENIPFEEIKQVFMNQGHSGMSHSLVCSMLIHFCDKGKDFVEYAK